MSPGRISRCPLIFLWRFGVFFFQSANDGLTRTQLRIRDYLRDMDTEDDGGRLSAKERATERIPIFFGRAIERLKDSYIDLAGGSGDIQAIEKLKLLPVLKFYDLIAQKFRESKREKERLKKAKRANRKGW